MTSGPSLTGLRPLALVMLGAAALRLAAAVIVRQPLESDALSYFTMARGLAEQGVLTDNFGQHIFYSAGYPLFLAPLFAGLGSSVTVAVLANAALAMLCVWLIHALTIALSGRRDAAMLAAIGYALWLPAIWNATMLAKENLSTPLLLALTLCAVRVARGERIAAHAMIGGIAWGAGLVTGGSSLLLCLGMAMALLILWRAGGRFAPAFRAGLCFLLGAGVMLGPWLYAADRMVGRPVLTTNAAFNLYLGNNPAATGKFVSIADTPMGAGWDARRRALGETGTADMLQHAAQDWIATHPGKAAELAARKLLYFWAPNMPDVADFAQSRAMGMIRLVDVAQYALIVLLGLWAFRSRAITGRDKAIVAAMIAGFWLIHAAAYIIPRYRDPVMPLLLLLAAVPVAEWAQRLLPPGRRSLPHAA